MTEMERCLEGLVDTNHTYAYGCLKQLEQESTLSSAVYAYYPRLAALLSHENSYVRTRALRLIAANVQWDKEKQTAEIIDSYLGLLTDPKPITVRQCIQSLPQIAANQPELISKLCSALRSMKVEDTGSMGPLIRRDIQNALVEIKRLELSHEMKRV